MTTGFRPLHCVQWRALKENWGRYGNATGGPDAPWHGLAAIAGLKENAGPHLGRSGKMRRMYVGSTAPNQGGPTRFHVRRKTPPLWGDGVRFSA